MLHYDGKNAGNILGFLNRLSTNHPEFSLISTLYLVPPIPGPRGDSAVLSGLFLGSLPPPLLLTNTAFSDLPRLLLAPHPLPSFKITVACVSSTGLLVLASSGLMPFTIGGTEWYVYSTQHF